MTAVLATPQTARAELPSPEPLTLGKVKGWEVSLDGRLNTFVSFSHGTPQPSGYPLWQGFDDKPASDGKITATRLRSGFVSNVLGWSLKKEVNKDYTLSGRFSIWGNVSQKRDKTLAPDVDLREVYLKVDGPWGGVLMGRNLGLFGRGGINLDYDIEHGYGLGSPCMIVNREPSQGPIGACGHVGFGILFPAFNAQITYNTPEFGGFQMSLGVFDPATVQERNYMRTPLPRFEGEVSFKVPKYFHAEVSGSWQRIGHAEQLQLNVDSYGVAAAAGANLGPVQLGVAGFTGQGLGIWVAMENYPVFSDDKFILRKQKGFLGMAAVNFGQTKIAAGVGETLVSKTGNDPPGAFTQLNFPAKQLGISAGIYQGVLENLVLGLDFFRADVTWNLGVDNMGTTYTPKQTVNFLNAGATLVF
ncbi:MAG TPA: porin [Polyangiaceae bacterium]|nr:porin [Polyangiaceae bacterium]